MAEKLEEEKAPDQNLKCPLCLDIFDEATTLTSCGHTFCRQCLKKYDLSHPDLDHMVCPLCRTITKFSANRVDDLPTDVTINELADEYHWNCGGLNAILEMCLNCTTCKNNDVAVSFCRTCNKYMCDECLHCHQHLIALFEGHEIVSIQDIIKGDISIGNQPEKCSTHKQEDKDMFCEDCKVHACLKCFVVSHRNHEVKNQVDFEQELRLKVKDLNERCDTKKAELEKNIQNVEAQRNEVHSFMQKLQKDVNQAYDIKAIRLKQNQRILIEEIESLKRSFDEDLEALKSSNRQRIKSMYSTMTLVDNDRLGRLEMNSLSAHTLLCEELDVMLKEVTDHTSAAVIKKKAQRKRFKPADGTCIDLGNVTEADDEPVLRDTSGSTSDAVLTERAQKKGFDHADDKPICIDRVHVTESDHEPLMKFSAGFTSATVVKEKAPKKSCDPADDRPIYGVHVTKADHKLVLKNTTVSSSVAVVTMKAPKKSADGACLELGNVAEADHGPDLKDTPGSTSVGVVREKAQKKRVDPANDTRLILGNISEGNRELHVIQCVNVKDSIGGMTRYSDGSVAIAYGNTHVIDIISSAGNRQQYINIPTSEKCSRLLFQQDRSVCIATGSNEAHVYSSKGSMKSTISLPCRGSLNLSTSPSDEFILTNDGKQVYIYDPTGTTLLHTLESKHEAWQAPSTRSGLIVTSCRRNPSMLTVHDRDGNAGKSLQAPSDVYLYATVDDMDRVYVASVDCKSSTVVLRLYDIDGLNLKERVEFNALNLKLDRLWGAVYFVSLSPDLLALACYKKLYFIKVSH